MLQCRLQCPVYYTVHRRTSAAHDTIFTNTAYLLSVLAGT